MYATQLLTSSHLPSRFIEDLAHFTTLNTQNLGQNRPNPLGNIGHSHETHRKRQEAIYECTKDKVRDELNTVSTVTGLARRATIAFDGGTAYKDDRRQIVTATYVDTNGDTTEAPLSARALTSGGATGNSQHVKDCSDILPLGNIAFTCSDDEPRYEGNKSGVCERLRCDPACSDKLIRLSDVSHRLERLVLPSSPNENEE